MRNISLLLALLMLSCMPALAGTKWEDATRDEIWLQDPDMYDPRHDVDLTLPNGFRLLYKETDLGSYSSKRNMTSKQRQAWTVRNLDLVKIQSPDGRMFMGLAEHQRDGNYLPAYGVIDGKEAVLYDYDINLKQLKLPEKLTGEWYAPLLRAMLEDADGRWKRTHGGRENIYTALGWVNDDNPYSFLFQPYAEEDFITFGDKPQYEFIMYWANDFPRMSIGEVTVKKSNGRKKSMAQETGGYIIDSRAIKWHSMSYDWNPETGMLTLKFGPKIRTKTNVSWHNWEGYQDEYNQNDFDNVNPGAAYMRAAVPRWAELSPDNVWGEITVRVYAVTDNYMVVSGKSVRAGWNFTEVWASEKHEGGLLSTAHRKEIVEYLMDRRAEVRHRKAAEQKAAETKQALEASIEPNVELMRTRWMPYICETFNAYRNGWTDYKAERGKYETPDISYAGGWIISDAYQKLTAAYGEDVFNESNRVCGPFLTAIDGDLFSEIVESRDFQPYRLEGDEISFLIGTRNGVKKLVYHAEYEPKVGFNNKLDGDWVVKGTPTLAEPQELLQTLEKQREILENLDSKEMKALKKQYPKEIKALQKKPKSVKDLQEAMTAGQTLSVVLDKR